MLIAAPRHTLIVPTLPSALCPPLGRRLCVVRKSTSKMDVLQNTMLLLGKNFANFSKFFSTNCCKEGEAERRETNTLEIEVLWENILSHLKLIIYIHISLI